MITKRETFRDRNESKRENTNENDESYLPASQDVALTLRLYTVCTDP